MLLCCCELLSEPVGFVVCYSMSCCGAFLLSLPVGFGGCLLSMCCSVFVLFPTGVDVDAGMIVMICSISGSTGVFLGELVILLIILSIFASLFVGLLSLLFCGACMNALGLSEVKICNGLPWDESDARLITSTDLSLCSRLVSSWISGEFTLSFCLCLAFSSFDSARAGSFEIFVKFICAFGWGRPFSFWLLGVLGWMNPLCFALAGSVHLG